MNPFKGGGHDPTQTGFNFQQLELSLSSNVDPYFSFNAGVVFSLGGVEVEEAYVSTLSLPGGLKVRAGQFLTRLGRINAMHPHSWAFLDQPIVMTKFVGGEASRGLGAELAWLTPLPWYGELIFSTNTLAEEHEHEERLGGAAVADPTVLDDLLYTGALKQFFTLGDDVSLLWGLSAQLGPNELGSGEKTTLLATDVTLKYQPGRSIQRRGLALTLELLQRSRESAGAILSDWGGYAQLVCQLSPYWETAVRAERVTGLEQDPLTPEWITPRSRYSAQITWRPSHFSRLRLQGSADVPEWLEEPIFAGMLGLEVTVGKHGAHEF